MWFILFHKHWHCLVMKICDISYVLSLHFSFTSKNVNWSFVNSYKASFEFLHMLEKCVLDKGLRERIIFIMITTLAN